MIITCVKNRIKRRKYVIFPIITLKGLLQFMKKKLKVSEKNILKLTVGTYWMRWICSR